MLLQFLSVVIVLTKLNKLLHLCAYYFEHQIKFLEHLYSTNDGNCMMK